MSPTQILALVRDTALVAGIALLLWFVYQGGKDRVSARDLKALQAQSATQSRTLDTWHQESAHATEKLTAAMAKIDAAAAVPIRHDWVRPPACSERAVLPTPSSEASDAHSGPGSVRPGDGSDAEADRRDQVIALYKQRWKTVLAQCQSVLDQWPSP